ncbi:HopJ type III effector protein [Zhongshania arctica]|uniref:HopJ type III effector protein n=1 Tax=Zhongshania arctica TaxID=3238302 RepID=A0ABV3TT93_9GAMM
MTSKQLIVKLNQSAQPFADVMAVIDQEYVFTPTAFTNGEQHSDAGSNNGSCKIFAFGLLHQLSEQATLNAFGDYYVKDVLENPAGADHANIRGFMRSGWKGIRFEGEALAPK